MPETVHVPETIRCDGRAVTLDVAAAIRGLRAAKDAIVCAELMKFQHRLRTLTPDQHRAVQLLLRRIANETLRPVIRHLKQAAEHGDMETIVRICELYCIAPLPFAPAPTSQLSASTPGEPDLLAA